MFADHIEFALEGVFVGNAVAAADEHLAMDGFGDGDLRGARKARIVDRHVAPAEQLLALGGDNLGGRGLDRGALGEVLRHEQEPDRVMPGIRQRKTERFGLRGEEAVGNLYQHPGAVTHQRIGPYGSAVGEILDDSQSVLDDPV